MSNLRLPIFKKEARAPEPAAGADELVSGARAAGGTSNMKVGDLARESGKTVRAIHLYEELDLLKPAARSKGRYRLYGPEALVRIRWIGKLQSLGFSLTDIKTIVKDLGGEASAPSAMTKVREVYKQKLEETRAQIRELSQLEREIEASLAYLQTCDSACEPDRSLPTCNSCDHHADDQAVPDLVAGFRP
jgi:DNA-binding transcriptional MerR regulator